MEQNTLTGAATYSKTVINAKGTQRRTAHRTTLEVPLRSVTSEQAPVGALISGNREFRARWPRREAEIRILDGQLYSQPLDTQGQPLKPGGEYLERHVSLSFSGFSSLEEAEDGIRSKIGEYLLIEGEIWTRVVEPVILIGAGSNSLTITRGNGNHPGHHAVFALKELDAAEQAQQAFDARHGFETKTSPTVQILIPSAFTTASSADRVQAARDEADQAVAAVVASLWMDRSPSSIHAAGLELMKLASELVRQTGEPLLRKDGGNNA